MIKTQEFGDLLQSQGFTFFTGVPCSFLKSLINYALNECEYVMAANEGDAVAIASGASLAGRKSVVLIQNSGLTNATSPLTSLTYIFKIPVLGFVSLRGGAQTNDEPQHQLMGEITTQFLDSMRISWEYLSEDLSIVRQQLKRAEDSMASGLSFFFVVKKNTFDNVSLKYGPRHKNPTGQICRAQNIEENPKRSIVLATVTEIAGDDVFIIATTGFTGRELFQQKDRAENLYMVGSMGCAASLGFGLALCQSKKKFIVLDGDGALLMRMGSLATLGFYRPENLIHILLDNEAHDSTGGQFTVSSVVDWVSVASACGYPLSIATQTVSGLIEKLEFWKKNPQLTFLTMKISTGVSDNLGRPSLSPVEVAVRFRKRVLESHDE